MCEQALPAWQGAVLDPPSLALRHTSIWTRVVEAGVAFVQLLS